MRRSDHQDARQSAQRALEDLGPRLAEREVLSVQCRHAHHVAAVYETPAGPVVRSALGARSRGNRDFLDDPHGASGRGVHVDLLETTASDSDELPGWCACGAWTLSRAELRRALAEGRRTLYVGGEPAS